MHQCTVHKQTYAHPWGPTPIQLTHQAVGPGLHSRASGRRRRNVQRQNLAGPRNVIFDTGAFEPARRLKSHRNRRTSPKVCRDRPGSGQSGQKMVENWQLRPKTSRIRSRTAPCRENWPKQLRSWPASPKIGRSRPRIGQHCPELSEVAPRIGRFRPKVADIAGRHRARIGRTRPSLAGIAPESAQLAPNWTKAPRSFRRSRAQGGPLKS